MQESVSPFIPTTSTWDYVSRLRVMVQRNAITRERPAFRKGWEIEFEIDVLLPEYVDSLMLQMLITSAGRFNGLGDFRPTYGRFATTKFEIAKM
ncbi:MAG: hypothetical protein ACR2KS_10250 [Candidatus Eremiobacter antarcticus]|nr:hypothetical protein [Candidatus Eremiobacteraeota bacterium]MBC5808814.1 hypothetical protein [Candidatus Eremiobacteraeota bacterium]